MTGIDLAIEFRVKFNQLNTNKNKSFLPEEINLLLQDQLKKVITTICSSKSNTRQEGYGDTRLRVDMIQDHIIDNNTSSGESGTLTLVSFNKGKSINLPADYYMLLGVEASSTNQCSINYRKPCREYPTGKDLRNILNNYFYNTTGLSPVAEVRADKVLVYEDNFTITAIYISYCKTLPSITYTSDTLPFSDDLWRIVVDDAVTKALAISNRSYEALKVETKINE